MDRVMDVMTAGCECIRENDTIATAAKMMADFDVGALPICDENKRLKGMLTDRDIVVRVVGLGKDVEGTRASELEQGTPAVVQADDTLDEAAFIMGDRQVKRLPVVDERGDLIGMLSQADIARRLAHDKTGQLVERLCAAA